MRRKLSRLVSNRSFSRRDKRHRLSCELLEARRVLAGPEVVSIVGVDGNPSNQSQIAFDVTFDESVSGVDTADFAIDSAGVSGASVASVSGSGAAYQVVVNTGLGSGTLRLDLIDNDSIINSQSEPLGGIGTTGTEDGSFTSGETYTIDKTNPAMSLSLLDPSPTNASTVRYQVTFSEDVVGLSLSNLEAWVLPTGNNPDLAGLSIASITGSGDSYVVTVNTGTGNGSIGLRVANDGNFMDLAGNAPFSLNGSGSVFTIDRLAPTVQSVVLEDASPTNDSSLRFLVTFSENVPAVSFSDVVLDQTGFPNAAVTTIQSVLGNQKRVIVSPGIGSGTISIDLVPTATMTDSAGNQVITPDNDFGAYSVDTQRPTVDSIALVGSSSTPATNIDFDVTFSESVTGVSASDFQLATSDVSGASIASITGSGSTYTVTVNTGTLDGTIGLNAVTGGALVDSLSNTLLTNFTGPVATIDKTLPTVASVVASNSSTNASSVDYTITFSEDVTGFGIGDLALVTGGAISGANVSTLTGSGSVYTATVDTGNGDGTVQLNLNAAATIVDSAGNSLVAGASGDLVTVDKSAPQITTFSAGSTLITNAASIGFDVVFSESVTDFGADDLQLSTSGLAGASITSVTGSGTTYSVAVSTGSGDGTAQLSLVAAPTVNDAAGNLLPATSTSSEVVQVDKTAPTSMSILRVSPPGVTFTNASTLEYQVTFPEPVTGVTMASFDPHTDQAGNVSLDVVNLTGSGTTYNVTVQVVSGDQGPVFLGIDNPGDVIQDLAGNPISNIQGSGVNYVVDQIAPHVTAIDRVEASPTSDTELDFGITFSESVTGVDTSDFVLDIAGLTGVAIDSVTGSGAVYTVRVSHVGGTGTIGLNLVDDNSIVDAAANALGGANAGAGDFVGQVYDIQSATIAGRVRFDQDADGVVDGVDSGLAGLTVFADLNDNGTLDAGEPNTLTIADDPVTTTINEAGTYTLAGLASGAKHIRVIPGSGQVQTSPVQSGSGELQWQEEVNSPNGLNLQSPDDLVFLTGGDQAVGIWTFGNKLVLYARDPIDGRLSYLDEVDAPDVYGGSFASATPDGQFLYVPGRFRDAISVFSISGNAINAVQTVSTTTMGNNLLNSVKSVSVSPDGKHLVASSSDGHLIVFDIDPANGQLTFLQSLTGGVEVASFVNPGQPKFSSDGSKVFVTSWNTSRLHVFDRDSSTGLLTSVQDDITLSTPSDVIVMPGDETLYVSSWADRVYKIQYDSQTDTFSETGEYALPSDADPYRITRTPDGRSIYLAAWFRDSITHLNVDPIDGSLTLVESINDGVDLDDFDSPYSVVISPDGRNAYVPVKNSRKFVSFWVDDGTRTPIAQIVDPPLGEITNGVDFTIAADAPRVTSIDRASGNISNAAQVDFTVTFSEDVTGVGTGNFELVLTDHPNATISSVTGGPQVYTVGVTTSGGEGEVAIQAIDDGSIVDGDANSAGTGNGSILRRSEAIFADQIAPEILSITTNENPVAGATSVDFFVSFREEITGVDINDFSLTSTGFASAAIDSVTVSKDVAIVSVEFTGTTGTLQVDLVDDDSIADLAGNVLGGIGTSGAGDGGAIGPALSIEPPQISGRVFFDADQDGLHDPGEIGRAGATIFVDANDNGVLDAGELSAVTTTDDPITVTIDEGGYYTIAGVTPASSHELRIVGNGLTQTTPLDHATDNGMLTFAESVTAPTQPNNYLYSANSVTVSPDGRHVYTTAVNGHALSVFSIDDGGSITTTPVFYKSSSPGFSGLSGPKMFLLSNDGRIGYLATTQTIFVVQRDVNDGTLTVIQRVESATGFQNLSSIRELALTPDGRTLFATASSSDALHVFDVNAADGTLSHRQELLHLKDGVTGLDSVTGVAVSPDGSQLFVGGYSESTVSIYDIVPGGGLVAGPQQFHQVGNVEYLAISPDGMDAYAGQSTGRLEHLRKDIATGDWVRQADVNLPSGWGYRIRISPEGDYVYVANRSADAIDVLSRDLATGSLTHIQRVSDVAPHDLLDYVQDIAITPDGSELFTAAWSDSSLMRFSRVSGATTLGSVNVLALQQSNKSAPIGVFNELPSVVSLASSASNPTNVSTIDFNLTLDEPVSGLDTSDFQIVSTSLTGTSIVQLAGGPTEYTITVDTGDGDGSMQLTLLDDDTIVDLAGDPIGGVGNNASVTSAAILVDHVAPEVTSVTSSTSPTNAAQVTFSVAFDEAVAAVDADDFSIEASGVVGAEIHSIAATSESTFDVIVNTGSGSGTLRLDVQVDAADPIVDPAGNLLPSGFTAGQQVVVDRNVPTVSVFELIGDTQGTDATIDYRVTFSEDVSDVDATDFTITENGVSGTSIQSITGGPTEFIVKVNTGSGTGEVTLNLVDNDTIVDDAGNALGGVGAGNGNATGPTYTVNFPPTITSVTPSVTSPTNQSTIEFDVLFSEDVSGVDASDFQLAAATVATFPGAAINSVTSADADTYSVEVAGLTGVGLVELELTDDDSIVDTLSVPLEGVGTQTISLATISVDTVAPSGVSISTQENSPSTADSIVFDVTFTEPVTGVGVDDFSVVATGISDVSVASIGGSGSAYTLTVNTGSTDGSIVVELNDDDSILDAAGNSLGGLGTATSVLSSSSVDLIKSSSITGFVGEDLGVDGTADESVVGVTVFIDANANGSLDSGEPQVQTLDDDPATTSIDEAGTFRFDPVYGAQARVRVLLPTVEWEYVSPASGEVLISTTRGLESGPHDFVIRQKVPELTSLTTSVTSPTNLSSLDFNAVFDEAVTGVDTSDFYIDSSDVSGYSITQVSGGGTSYTITIAASAPAGDGTLRFGLNDDDSIVSTSAAPLNGFGTSASVAFVDLQVDHVVPVVSSVLSTNSPIIGTTDALFTVTFSENVTGVDVADFSVVTNGDVAGASVQSVSVGAQANVYDVVVNSGTGDGTIGLNLEDNDSIIDGASNSLGGDGVDNGDFVGETAIVERNPLRTISGTVFNDADNDGVRDAGEEPADGSQIYIDLNGNGELDISTEPYDWYVSNGAFSFPDLTLGSYTLRITDRKDYVESAFSTTTIALGFDDNPLVVDVPATKNEAGFTGIVFNDLNQNGVHDAGEPGIPNQRVYWDTDFDGQFESNDHVFTLDDDPGTAENETGTYVFSPVWLQLYQIRVDRGPEWLPTSGEAIDETFNSPTQTVAADFGLTPNLTSISGLVFDDLDADGTQQVGENPVAGWTVFLDSDDDGVLDAGEPSQITDATGTYSFDQLALGNHRLRIVPQSGSVITSSDSAWITLGTSTDTATVDFATHANLTTVSGSLFEDVNTNGVLDAGEAPIVGATVYLDTNDNGRLDAGEPTVTTAAAGDYAFSDVQPGEVVVRIVEPSGYFQTSPSQSVDRLFVWHGGTILREIDPTDGSTIADYWHSSYPTSSINADGLAFDGTSLWAMDRGQQTIFEIDPDAITIESQIDFSSYGPATFVPAWNGLAIIDSTIHLTAGGGEYIAIDSETGSLINTASIFSVNVGSPHLSGVGEILGLGKSTDGQSLVASTDSNKLLTIDPVTLAITDSGSVTAGQLLSGVGSVGGTTYVSENSSSSLLVLDAAGNQTGTLVIGCRAVAIAGGSYQDFAARFTVTLDQQLTNVDFGATLDAGGVAGIQFLDENGNGVQDLGEQPLAGVTVFADLNDNGSLDAGEPSAVSGADGSYTITNISPGQVVIRSEGDNLRPSDSFAKQDRLFGLRNGSGFYRIDELDPADGTIIDTFLPSINYTNAAVAMAFDGDRLFVIDSIQDKLFQIGLDGSTISSVDLTATEYGPVVIDGNVYSVRLEWGSLSLFKFDFSTNAFVKVRPITYDWGLTSMPAGYSPERSDPLFTSGVSADGQRILLGTDDDRIYEIDPATGIAIFDPEPSSFNGTDYGIDSVGGETFISYSGLIDVQDGNGNLLRTLSVPTYVGLAGGSQRDNGLAVNVVAGQTASVDHGHVSTLSSLSGTAVTDANENGVSDVGESPIVGATVFLDLNVDGALDAGEPTAITDSNGAYAFNNLQPGEYVVRQVAATGSIARAFAPNQTRLFQAIRGTDNIVFIQEVDPETGDILNQFNPPLPNAAGIGLAAKGDRVYYSRGGAIDILDADTGTVLDTITISSGTKDGIAVIGDHAYVQDYGANTIEVVDLITKRVTGVLDIGLANGGGEGSFDLAYSLAESPDGVNLLVVPFSGGDVSIVDPNTGVIIDTFATLFAGHGSTSAGGEYFERGAVTNGIQNSIFVHDHLALRRRAIPVNDQGYVYGLGSTSIPATSHRVFVASEQSVIGIDFGSVPESRTVSGVQFVDVNENESFDVGEQTITGVTVYADLNANGIVDAGEPSTVSASDGTYTLFDVPRDSVWIRTTAAGFSSTSVVDSDDRLIATTRASDGNSPTQYVLQIRELDPATGLIRSNLNTDVPVLAAYASAIWRDRLIVIDNTQDKLFQVALDGTLVSEAPLPETGGTSAYAFGPAVIDGTVYIVMTGGGDSLRLERYDVHTNLFYGAMRISAKVPEDSSIIGMPSLSEAIAESPDGKSILLFSHSDDRVFVVDPKTARVTEVQNLPETDGFVYSAGTAGGELHVRSQGSSGNLAVYDANYVLDRTIGNPQASGLAAGRVEYDGVIVAEESGANVNLDIGQHAIYTDITGFVSYDANVNGIVDAGEATAGATVFLDANRNSVLDAGELTTTTLSDGSYSFTQLPPGDYTVAVDRLATDRVETTATETALYALEVTGGVSTIRKHDPITGHVLRQFAAPGDSSDVAGLAVDDYALYYSSIDGLWVLDHDTGSVKDYFDLPDAPYDGLAAVDGKVFVLDSFNESILSIAPRTGTILDTFLINQINQSSYSLSGNLGESTDGKSLILRLPFGGGLVINPDTGVIKQWYAYNNGAWSIAGADGELYRSNGTDEIRVESEFEQHIRNVPIGYEPRGLAAGVVPASAYELRATEYVDFNEVDFQLAPVDQFPPISIGGVVWDDADQDGHQDPGENGIAGATVYLDINFNGILDANDVTQVTASDDPGTAEVDESGTYQFDGLTPGIYDVRQELLPSHLGTSPFRAALQYDERYDTNYSYTGFHHHPEDDLRLSETGRYLVYSTARQVLPSDTNSFHDVYLLDRETNQHELISVNSSGIAANDASYEPDVSTDGRYVVFRTWARNLDQADTDFFLDVYVRDRELGTTTLLTAGVSGGSGNGNSRDAVITPDGKYVVLTSWGNQLVAGDTNNLSDTFLFDLQAGTTQRISEADGGGQLTDASSWGADITPDGRYVLFESGSGQLATGDSDGMSDIFRKDMLTGDLVLASSSVDGTPSNSGSQKRSISDDGRWVVFDSSASNLTNDLHAGPGESYYVYLKDLSTGEIKRISETRLVNQPDGNARRPEISGSGRFVVFESDGQLVSSDTNDDVDVYLYDRIEDELILVSQGDNGEQSRDASNNPVISADGSTIAFTTVSSNILGLNVIGGIVTVDVQKLLTQHQVNVSPGESSFGNDFGQTLVTSSISGQLWQDDNGDGVFDASETALAGRTVFLDINDDGVLDAGEPSTVTVADDPQTSAIDESGSYQFSGLVAGDYTVRQVLPVDWTQTFPLQVAGLELLVDTDYISGVNTTTQPIYDSASSDHGRFVAFSTDKSLLPIDTNSGTDIYVMDRTSGELDLITQSSSGELANHVNRLGDISGDGRFVVFRSFATNLSLIDDNNTWDIYLRDRQLGTTTLVSSKPAGQTGGEVVGNSFSYTPSISRDGNVVTFWSDSDNLVGDDTNGRFDIFLKDLTTGAIERINLDSAGNQAAGGESHESQANDNGSLVGFWSNAVNLVSGDNNGTNDVFIRDRSTGMTERVSVSATGVEGNGSSDHFSMSNDGRFFAFQSNATNLTDDVGLTGSKQIFLKDRQSGDVILVSKGDSLPDGVALFPEISADGRWITYQSTSTNIIAGDNNGVDDVFLFDRLNGTTTRLSEGISGDAGNGPSDWTRMSRDGSTITFNSSAPDLVGQPPVTGGLYVYRTPTNDPYALNVAIGIGQDIDSADFGSQPMEDHGDAPESYGSATHLLDTNVRLGANIGFDTQSGTDHDDDDGVIITSRLSAGFLGQFDVTTSTTGTLAAWIDFNGDGDFDSEERSEFSIGTLNTMTTDSISISIPSNATIGDVQARFRFSTDAASVQQPVGQAVNGEVEDYVLMLQAPIAASDILLSSSSIDENADTSVSDLYFASLSAIDEDYGDTHGYALVSGAGDTDNGKFVISGDQLLLKQGEVLDYEVQSTYSVRVAATDGAGLAYQQVLSLEVNNVVELTKQNVVIGDGNDQRSRIETLSIQFDDRVAIDADAFSVVKLGSSGGSVAVDFTTRLDGNGHTIADLTFSGTYVQYGSLMNGNYQLTIDGTKISSVNGAGMDTSGDGWSGDQMVFGDVTSDDFFCLYGDMDGDGDTDANDLNDSFAPAFFSTLGSAAYVAALDGDNDGDVDANDLNDFFAPNFFATRDNI